MSERLITLLTDFGSRDPYVGIMKGVMLGICPAARFVDLCHEIAPQDVLAAAFYLRGSWSFFPSATVHLVVVDPGVGTARRMLCAEAGGQRFIAPDNGVLEGALRGWPGVRWWSIAPRRWIADRVPSQTFHGRDHFAPVAAHLAAGAALAELAAPIDDPRALEWSPPASLAGEVLCGQIVVVDRFGNLLTDLPAGALEGVGSGWQLELGTHSIERFARTYGEVPAGELFAYAGSFETVEVACSGGSAAERLGLGAGEMVRLRPPQSP